MVVPMVILAVGSVGAGAFFAINDRLANWLTPSVGEYEHPEPPFPAIYVTVATLAVVAVGVFIAYWFVGRRPVPVAAPDAGAGRSSRCARADVGGNAINETLFARPGIWLTRTSVYADTRGIDGAVNGTAALLGGLSGRWRHWQNGFVRSYALSMFAGTLGGHRDARPGADRMTPTATAPINSRRGSLARWTGVRADFGRAAG